MIYRESSQASMIVDGSAAHIISWAESAIPMGGQTLVPSPDGLAELGTKVHLALLRKHGDLTN